MKAKDPQVPAHQAHGEAGIEGPGHRRELDGLRALAVVPVLFFHSGLKAFSGGFIGVDVFFVLSGYLISRQITAATAQGTWSIARFYERRIRRILPALYLVILACIPWAMVWLMPEDRANFLASASTVVAFVANIFFWRDSGYFEATNEIKPLMHAWSLSIEEQFYVLFPLALATLLRWGRRPAMAMLVLVTLLSFALSVWSSMYRPGAAFYLLPSRAWELLAGALLAVYPRTQREAALGSGQAACMAAFGLLLVLGPVFAFDSSTTFPGALAALPVLGTVLVIRFARPGNGIYRLLCWRPMVQVGVISYSLYLWHQPLLAFARQRVPGNLDADVTLALLAASLPMAYATWYLVERPVRARTSTRPWHTSAVAVAGGLILVATCAALEWASAPGAILSPAPQVSALDGRLRPNYGLSETCRAGAIHEAACSTAPAAKVLVWGDSFAMHLMAGIVSINPDLPVQQVTVSGCGPILGIAPLVGNAVRTGAANCIEHNAAVLDYLRRTPSIELVILSSAFRQYLETDARIALADGQVVSGPEHAADYLYSTIGQIRQLGRQVWLVAPPPRNGIDLGRCLAKSVMFRFDVTDCDFALEASLKYQGHIFAVLRKIEREGTVVVWPHLAICPGGQCQASRDGVFIYRDIEHLSYEGSLLLGNHLRNSWNLAWPAPDSH